MKKYQNTKPLKILKIYGVKKELQTYAILIKETQPRNKNSNAKKRLDQVLFKPLNLNSFTPKFHY